MARLALEQLSDFGDFTNGAELSEIIKRTGDELSNVRLSPDGRHVHVIPRGPTLGLVTLDKYERPLLAQNHKKLDLRSTRTVPVVDILYLDHRNSGGDAAAVAVVYENGKAEFWKYQECKAGWRLLQTSDLCNSPRAKVVSVCACANMIVWCEERAPSESAPALSSPRNKLRYCVCRRDFEVEEGAVSLGGVRIALHNNPKFTAVSSGEFVHLLPDVKGKPPMSISKCFVSWSPRRDSFTISATCKSTPLKKLSAQESDLKKLVTDCVGYLSTLEPPEICAFSPTACGGLLLLLATGWVCILQKDGTLRRVYKLSDNCSAVRGAPVSLCMYQDIVAVLFGQNLRLIDVNCGRELARMTLKEEGLLYENRAERGAPHLLSESGLFVVVGRETGSRDCSAVLKQSGLGGESVHPGALLVEAVFEEACKYYQQRSLSSTQLTVDALKTGGRFQAPTSLASILRNYLGTGPRQKGAEPAQNGGAGCAAGQDKLTGSLEAELKALVSLEEVKGSLVRGNPKEVLAVCESLVEKEVARLLSASELDKEALLYLNSLFSVFPGQLWRAARAALQLHCNGDGSLSSGAPADVWKTVLSAAGTPGSPTCFSFTNGGPKSNHSLKADHNANRTAKPSSASSPAALPVFELLCHSVFHFQPSWLPRFLELAQHQQQQQGSAGLGLSLASSSSWGFSGGRGGEAGDNNVPLYKRALCVLSGLAPDRDRRQDLEVELMLVSGRPNAILQALRILMAKQRWERVTQVAQKFCKQSPLLNKEIFTTLLCEVIQHRDLDPYLDLLWALCPEELTVTTILNLVLKNLPSSNAPSSSSFAASHNASTSPAPFADPHSGQLTVGLLKPLLKKVLQRETKPSQRYADILQSPSFPPPAPPRQPAQPPRSVSDPCNASSFGGAETPDRQSSSNTTVQRGRAVLPADLISIDKTPQHGGGGNIPRLN
ncbi:BLOC-2 complex member HPS6 [Gasterosteus aculeatus]|uniref:HPS6 biogenesis of lysosomal organelles complex 2 subunit 3 n=1 Tax=Gasterosteus aculeatus aculeatus TaxID=481459 RepID=G3NWP0_GASAC|nr:Hermansky-Pudlak syndrome 6 protein [Gasterosteus aculeatus aculeatus]